MNSSAARGHDDLDCEAALHQGARQLRRFVGGDASADAERDVHSFAAGIILRRALLRTRWNAGSSYCTSPRRTSSMAATVGFFEVVGRKLRAPFCNWRARLAATMMKR